MANEILNHFRASYLHDKNINFLIGSGASASYIPTLKISDDKTYEDILTDEDYKKATNLIYYRYYHDILKKSICLRPDEIKDRPKHRKTLSSYKRLIESIVTLIDKKSANQIRRANIFTTNYDLFLEKSSDFLLSNSVNFIFNDGARGLTERYLKISNFHTSTWHQGTNDLYKFEIPTLNVIKMHGSISWMKISNDLIRIHYPDSYDPKLEIEIENTHSIQEIVETIENHPHFNDAKAALDLSDDDDKILDTFRENYNKLAVVNPTKAKFEETVFQQHFYQSLRLLSYELEKPQTVLICFGFSFKDEHIREIIARSISNPFLVLYIFCYKKSDKDEITKIMSGNKIVFIYPDNDEIDNVIDINRFINCIFNENDPTSLEGLICSL